MRNVGRNEVYEPKKVSPDSTPSHGHTVSILRHLEVFSPALEVETGAKTLEKCDFLVPFGPATSPGRPRAQTRPRIQSFPGKMHPFRLLGGRCNASGARAQMGPSPVYPGFVASLG